VTSLNDLQERVLRALLTKIGAGPAAFYLDSCTLRELHDQFMTAPLLVAHALREARSGIEERLDADPSTGDVVGANLSALRRKLHELAHRRRLDAPQPYDELFRGKSNDVDAAFATLLDSYAPTTNVEKESVTAFVTRPASIGTPIGDADMALLHKFLDHVAPGPTASLHDALLLQDSRFSILLAQANFIAHALRETESALRDVMLPYDFQVDETREDRHLQEVIAILTAYGIAADDPAARSWIATASPSAERGLAARAHHTGFGMPRVVDEDLSSEFRSLTGVFAALLDHFEYMFGRYIHRLDEILASKNPLKKAFLGELPQTEAIYEYFFRRLENPAWVPALRDTDVFRRTPEPRRRGTTTVLPSWPQGDYLRRILASNPKLAPEIWTVIQSASASENPRVHEEIAKIALLLPQPTRNDASRREAEWLDKQGFIPFLLAEAVGALAERLGSDGEIDEATKLLRILLGTRVEEIEGREQLIFRSDRFVVERILEEAFKALALPCGPAILEVASDTLESLRRFEHPSLVPPVDYSYVWRPAIEEHSANLGGDLRGNLIDAMRDAAQSIIAADESRADEIVQFFLGRPWHIDHRIGIHIAAASDQTALAANIVGRPEFLDCDDYFHEVTRLLHTYWARFDDETRSAIAEFILTITESDADARAVRQWRQISRLPQPLPEQLRPLATVLRQRFGELPDPDLLSRTKAGFVQTRTPKTRGELKAMEVPDIVAFLRGWEPKPINFVEMIADSPSALAEDVRSIVAARPEDFAPAAPTFAGLRPVYIRGLLDGFADAAKTAAAAKLDWKSILQFVRWVLVQPRSMNDHRSGNPEAVEGTWLFARRAIIDLISNAIRSDAMPRALIPDVLGALAELGTDPDPSESEDSDSGGGAERWWANSHGSVRPRAVRTLVLLGHRFGRDAANSDSVAIRRRVLDLLERRLDTREEPSPSVRFAIGNSFLPLLGVDDRWTREHVAAIFTRDELREAAWAGYLDDGLSPVTQELLMERYRDSIRQLRGTGEPSHVEKLLAQHIALIHGYAPDSPDRRGFVESFFAKASEKLRYHALWTIADHVRSQAPAQLPLDRFMSLWTWRVEGGASAEELTAFDEWALAGRFPERWVLEQLTVLGEKRVTFLRYTLLIELLERLQAEHSVKVAVATRALSEAETEFVQLHAARHGLRRIAEAAMSSTSATSAAEARRLANILTARGLSDFKDLT
jgi:hypothetical protein